MLQPGQENKNRQMENNQRAELVISVVMTCHNRRERTIECLKSLFSQTWKADIEVYLVDDGCTDGTRSAVAGAFPSIQIIEGNGELYWGGGMHKAMLAAAQKPFDYMLWLNDDVLLKPNASERVWMGIQQAKAMHSGAEFILVGATASKYDESITYSGLLKTSKWHPARLSKCLPIAGNLTPCDTLNGNFVLVTGAAYKRLGPVDAKFIHSLGDIDYGYRAGKARIPVWLLEESVGYCELNAPKKSLNQTLPLAERLSALNNPLGFHFSSWIAFLSRYLGPFGFLLFLAMVARRLH